jgi:hypothetical protein
MLLSFLAVLYAGALLLLTTGLMGMSSLCSFNWALRGVGGWVGFFLCPVSDLFLLEDEVALLQGFGDEALVLFGGVARGRVDIVTSEEGMYFFFVVLLVYVDCSFFLCLPG